ncbi:NAD-dependent epimerase/dehydratase family protein [Silvibacterium sp.]|uniref:NAD-dependent epimerase/dehydratase family protein n=1 Tax=Silvibacterium sp. TaxID=1964179 RepID=UPI0039E3822B
MGFWKGKRVFVTGATGLMGGWLVKALLREEAEVIALVRDQAPRSMLVSEGILSQLAIVSGDLESLPTMVRAIAEYEPHTVFHLAAQPLVGVAKKDPVGTLRANVMGTWNLLEACRLAGGQSNVVVASSDKAYGSSENLPYLETHPLQGRYPYDVSKSCTDLVSQMYAATYGLRTAIARCGNLFGGGDLNFSRTIPGLVKATLDGEPFVIRSDGKFVRDFLYVKDAAECYLVLGEHLASNPALSGEAFNFSLGERLTVLDIVEMTLDIMDRRDLQPVIQNIASSEIREQYLDASKARRLLGWQPKYDMPEAIRETVDWYREHFQAAKDAR